MLGRIGHLAMPGDSIATEGSLCKGVDVSGWRGLVEAIGCNVAGFIAVGTGHALALAVRGLGTRVLGLGEAC
jgi:hypothetical protein